MDKLEIATEKWLAARRSGRSLSPPDDEQLRQWWLDRDSLSRTEELSVAQEVWDAILSLASWAFHRSETRASHLPRTTTRNVLSWFEIRRHGGWLATAPELIDLGILPTSDPATLLKLKLAS
jgi:hypothetical protein